jgi:hypothetical protein
MATKIQRVRRIAAIAFGAVRAIFRTGRAWGTARTRVASARRPAPTPSTGAAVAAGAAGGAAGAYFLDPQHGKRRRNAARDRARAVMSRNSVQSESDAQDAARVAKDATSKYEATPPPEAAPTKETVAAGR